MDRPHGAAIWCVENEDFRGFLDRKRRPGGPSYEVDLRAVFSNILEKANDFVPSGAGSIFLDEPAHKGDDRSCNSLVFVAAFGESARELVGRRHPSGKGIVGKVYQTGVSYRSDAPRDDASFNSEIDEATDYVTTSLICVPLRIEGEVVGVIELINRLGRSCFTQVDLELLEIFAQTISTSLTNALDAARAKELARRDDLSGLYNDRYFHDQLSVVLRDCLEGSMDCGLLFLDLDHFKSVNDTHGHLSGSRVLKEIGGILRDLCPPPSIAARYGGDEFVVICPGAGPEQVRQHAERIRSTIAEHVFLAEPDPFDPDGLPACNVAGIISCSVGTACLRTDVRPGDGLTTGQLSKLKTAMLRVADTRMYRAKDLGRNQVVGRDDRE